MQDLIISSIILCLRCCESYLCRLWWLGWSLWYQKGKPKWCIHKRLFEGHNSSSVWSIFFYVAKLSCFIFCGIK